MTPLTVRIGPYTFRDVAYKPWDDLMDLSIDGRGGVGDVETPEGDVWFVADDTSDEIVALQIEGPAHRLALDGRVTVTLPDGTAAVAEGIETAVGQPV
jgi:hypothetical protein